MGYAEQNRKGSDAMQDLLKTMRRKSEELPPAQRAVAEYVLAHYQEVPFLSVTALADEIGVSDTTVIKFCLKLGFDGYSGFRRELSAFVQSGITMYSNLENRLDELGEQSTLDQVLSYDRANIEETLTNPINRQNFDRLLAMIGRAKTVYVCGFRTAAMQAEFLAAGLLQQDRNVVTVIPGTGHYADQLSRVTKDDLFLAFVFSRYSSDVIRALHLMQKEEVPCAAITDDAASPAYGLADLSFLCATRSCNYQASYAGCTALCNAILTGTSRERREETSRFLRRLEDAFTEFGTFSR